MKLLPWAILSILLVSSIVFGQVAPAPDTIKTLGIPAVDEWLDIESGTRGGAGTQFVVPSRKALTLVYQGTLPLSGGSMSGTVDIAGTVAINVSVGVDDLKALYSGTPADPWMHGLTASAGQIVTVTRTGGGAPNSEAFFVRGWLESLP